MMVDFLKSAWLLGCFGVTGFCIAALARFSALILRKRLGTTVAVWVGAGAVALLCLCLPALGIILIFYLTYIPRLVCLGAATVCAVSAGLSVGRLRERRSSGEIAWLACAALGLLHLAATVVWLRF